MADVPLRVAQSFTGPEAWEEQDPHEDTIKLMRGRGGNPYVGGRLIMEDGLPAGFSKK